MALDWSQCPAVESVPGKVSGAWVFRGTRMPVAAVFENLEGFGLVFNQGIALAMSAQPDTVAEAIHLIQVFLPQSRCLLHRQLRHPLPNLRHPPQPPTLHLLQRERQHLLPPLMCYRMTGRTFQDRP